MTTYNGKSAIESTEQALPDYRQGGVPKLLKFGTISENGSERYPKTEKVD